ncbi:MAG: hypothetical protein P4L34_01170 [Paludibacter sp.]|nr:hypothetical protein [Paludibacter sp.]
MDYREQLFRPLSKHFVDHLVEEIFANPFDFNIVYQLIFDSDNKVAWRAAWACQKISEKHPEWFTYRQFNELASLIISTKNAGLQRGCLSILNNIALPSSISVEFINTCFERMISPRSAISVQVISMKILFEICKIEPDFITEFRTYLETISPDDYSKGFNAARNNILKKLIAK